MNQGETSSHTLNQELGRYRLLKRVGKGGMGEVWLAEDPRLHRQVAIKTLPVHNQDDRDFLRRFEREAQAAATLNHPHILPVYDYGEQPLANGRSITYIVMPYVAGGVLSKRISAFRNSAMLMPAQEALQHLTQAAEAIDYAHDQGVVHRDIKPGNMLMRSENWLLLADFGIARIVSNEENLTQTGVGFGTPEYMAPEQAQGKAELSSDNYSLAVIGYQLFVGRLPFKAETAYATTIQHLMLPPPAPRQINPAISLATEQVLLQGLAKQAAQRPPTARAYVSELRQSLTGSASSTFYSLPAPPGSQPLHPSSQPGPSAMPVPTVDPTTTGATLASATTVISTGGKQAADQPTQRQKGIARRRLLIGVGGAATLIAAGGGLAAWISAAQLHAGTTQTQNTHLSGNSTPVADPDAPSLILRGHNSHTWSLAWSPLKDSLILASAGNTDDHQVLLWDIQQLQKQATSSQKPVVRQPFSGNDLLLVWSQDGKYLGIGGLNSESDLNATAVTVYANTLNTTAPGFDKPIAVGGSNVLYGLSWLQGKYLVTGQQILDLANLNGTDKIQIGAIDITQPQPQWIGTIIDGSLETLSSVSTNTTPFVASPDGSMLAINTLKGVLIGNLSIAGKTLKWQQKAAPFQLRQTQNNIQYQIDALTWSPDNQTLAAFTSETAEPSIVSWQWNNQKNVTQIGQSQQGLTTLAWCPVPSSPLLATGTKDGTVLIWDRTKNQSPIRSLNNGGIKAAVGTLAWSANGQWLAAGLQDNYGSILTWKIS